MEKQKQFKTNCVNCDEELVVPTITDCGMSFQIAAAKCQCGWEQPGRRLKNGFIATDPSGYCNLTNIDSIMADDSCFPQH